MGGMSRALPNSCIPAGGGRRVYPGGGVGTQQLRCKEAGQVLLGGWSVDTGCVVKAELGW